MGKFKSIYENMNDEIATDLKKAGVKNFSIDHFTKTIDIKQRYRKEARPIAKKYHYTLMVV